MIKKQKYLIKNPNYKSPCFMEGHISNKYDKFITSRPRAYFLDGLVLNYLI